MLRSLPLGDPLDGMALHDLRKHGRTTRVRWHEHAELPGDDLMEKAVSAEALAHRVGEAGELDAVGAHDADAAERSEEHTSELQSLMRISYAVFCLKKKKTTKT